VIRTKKALKKDYSWVNRLNFSKKMSGLRVALFPLVSVKIKENTMKKNYPAEAVAEAKKHLPKI